MKLNKIIILILVIFNKTGNVLSKTVYLMLIILRLLRKQIPLIRILQIRLLKSLPKAH